MKLLDIVLEEDWDAIEGCRNQVDERALAVLMREYWSLGSWMQKVALVNLVQDQVHPDLRAIMLDVLNAPGDDDITELTRAIALGFVDEKYDRFMHYYENRAALAADVAEVLGRAAPVATARPMPPLPATPPADLDASLLAACVDGHEALALYLLEHGADVHARRVADQTPLWWAAYNGFITLVRELLRRGANPNAADIHGGTPLHQAVAHPAVVRELLGAGANMRAVISDGRTPPWFAAYTGSLGAVEAFLDAGLGVDEAASGKTLLALAAENGHAEIVELLLGRGASVDLGETTPLMLAAERGYPTIVALLLAAGADRSRAAGAAIGRRADEIRALLGK